MVNAIDTEVLIPICPRCGTTSLTVDTERRIVTGQLHRCNECKWQGYHPDMVWPSAGWYGTYGSVGPRGNLP